MADIEIPDALSSIEASPHYRLDFATIGRWIDIYLDRVLQDQVLEYDRPAGYVIRLKFIADGKVACDPVTGDLVTEKVRGEVVLRLRGHDESSEGGR